MITWGRYNQFNLDTAKASLLSKAEKIDECLIWKGAISSHGYGSVGFMGKAWMAHRASYYIHTGVDPAKNEVMHTCDTPLCINPNHLTLGSHTDNMLDMEGKKRSRHFKGSQHGRSKLTENAVLEMRKQYESGISYQRLANQYGVSKRACMLAVKGVTWTHI